MSSLSEVLSARYSCRDFTSKAVPAETLDAIFADALQAPSWSNTQPYRFAMAEGEVRDRLASVLSDQFDAAAKIQARPRWRQALAFLFKQKGVPAGDFKQALVYPKELQGRRNLTASGLYHLLGIERHDIEGRNAQTKRNFEFFGAPTVVFVFVHQGLGVYSVLDAGIVLQSLMLAAEARGVASCAQGALAVWRAPLDAEFDIPKDYKLLCGLSLGYASDHPVNQFASERLSLSDLSIEARTPD